MQEQAYAAGRETATTFSAEQAPDSAAPPAPALWDMKRAQWEIIHLDFSRPQDSDRHTTHDDAHVLAWAKWRRRRNYPPAHMLRSLALILALNVNRKQQMGQTWVSKGTLCRFLGRPDSDRRAVQRALRALEEDFHVIEFVQHEKPWQGRTYRLTVGWASGALQRAQKSAPALDPVRATKVMRAYHVARLLCHQCGGRHAKVPPVVLAATVRMVEDVAADTGETFEAAAELAMDCYMSIEGYDPALRKARHPLAWIEPHLSAIESQLRRAHRRRRQREQTPPEVGAAPVARGDAIAAAGSILATLRKGTP